MADGPKPPKGWLITGLVFLLLSLAGCGGGTLGCASFGSDLQDSVDQGGRTPLGESSTFTASGSKGAILATATSATCEGTDADGNRMSFDSPGSNTSGNVTTDGESFDLAFIFDSTNGQSYTVTCTSPSGTGDFLVVPFPGFTSLIAGIGGIAAGVLFFIIGSICVIVGLVKRSGWKKRNGPGAPVAAAAFAGGSVPPPPGGFNPGAAPQPGYAPPAPGSVPPAPGYPAPQPGSVPPAPPVAPPQPGSVPPAPPQQPGSVPPAPPLPGSVPPSPPSPGTPPPPPPPAQP